MSRWFKSAAKGQAMTAEEEDRHLYVVEAALLKLVNDDIAEADKDLKEGDSSYHLLGRGVSSFITAMLSLEKELLKTAGTTLQAAETKTWDDSKKSRREPAAFRSEIYPPGTEYLLCFAIAQVTNAIAAVMSGSVTQAIAGFYKLRKAFMTLDGIMDIESKYFEHRFALKRTLVVAKQEPLNPTKSNDGTAEVAEKGYPEGAPLPPMLNRARSKVIDTDPASLGITHHTDIFIHSGTRLCYGILQVVFSMIQSPVFNKILYIIGFKGDRENGTRYLWEASRFDNFNSAIAGFSLFAYYNGLVGSCDILPTDPGADYDITGYPKAKCRELLASMLAKYPTSKFWRLEEARMLGDNHDIPAAVKRLQENSDGSMRQIASINTWERALHTTFNHDYETTAKDWIQCFEFSKWSPCFYSYMSGVAYLEIYRNTNNSDAKTAAEWKTKAIEYILKAPPLAGQQKMMAKQLPIDVYVTRKVQKWEERAKAWGVDLADVIGSSPLAEMCYIWNGVKKMATEQLNKTLSVLDWSRTSQPEKHKADLDETAANAVIRASLLRSLGNFDQARKLLQTEILNHERFEFQGPLKDDWPNAMAHYEMAILAWLEKDAEGADAKAKVQECEQWIEKISNWGESYVLEERLRLKVSTSILTIKRHKTLMGY